MRRATLGLAVAFVASLLGVIVAPQAMAAPMQTQKFVISLDIATGTGATVATGPISGTGVDNELGGPSTGAVSHNNSLIVFPNGTLTVKSVGHDQQGALTAACTAPFFSSGNFVITGGTGAYRNAKGAGSFSVTGSFTFPVTASGCDFDHPSGIFTIVAVGLAKK